MELWGDPGTPIDWRFDPTCGLGSYVEAVIDLVCTTDDMVVGSLFPCGTRVKVGGIEAVPEAAFSLTVLKAQVVAKTPVLTLQVEDRGDVIFHRRSTRDDLRNMVELCAGIGVGTMGFSHAGMKTVVAVDWCEPFVSAFQELHPDIPAIRGDIGDTQVLKQIHQAHPFPTTLSCGFSCQPFSAGGSRKGAGDERSSSLPKALRVAFRLRSLAVILECVQDAGSNSMVRSLVDTFASQCGYKLAETTLRLEDVWVSRRSRWWAVLTAPFLGCVQLQSFIASEHPSVPRDVFSSPLSLAQAELDQLVLSSAELEKFTMYEANIGKLFLKLDSKCPTALHSWGSQAVGCRCGCRDFGFSHESLSSKGIFGVLIPMPETGNASDSSVPLLRHPHPTEVGLLNGVPEIVWPADLRLVVAGLGQMMSPLQAVWIAGQLQRHFDIVLLGDSALDPIGILDQLKGQVLQLVESLDFMPVPAADLPEPPVDVVLPGDDLSCTPWAQFCHLGGPHEVTVVHDFDLVPYLVRLADPEDTISAVLAATLELLDFKDHDVRVLDCASGLDLPVNQPAAGRCLWITSSEPHAVVEPEVLFTVSPTVPWFAEPAELAESSQDVVRAPSIAAAGSSDVFVAPLEPLASLSAERLLLVSEPSVTDLSLLNALRAQTMDTQARKQTLANQGTVWADDEMMYHMLQMHSVAKKPTWAVIDPLLCAEALKRPSSSPIGQWIRSLDFKPTAILGVVCVNQHWIPFIWTWTPHCLIASSWDIPGSPPHELSVLHQAIALAVGSRTHTVHVVHRKFAVDQLCGICALRFIDMMLRGKMLPTSSQEAMQLHAIGRSLFVAYLDSVTQVPRPWIFGAELDPKASDRLHGLLSEHGVDSTQVKNRASLLLQAIGLATAQKALTSGQPWRALKAAANQCRPPFQLVLSAELEASVGKKASQGGLKGRKKNQPTVGKPQNKPEAPLVWTLPSFNLTKVPLPRPPVNHWAKLESRTLVRSSLGLPSVRWTKLLPTCVLVSLCLRVLWLCCC